MSEASSGCEASRIAVKPRRPYRGPSGPAISPWRSMPRIVPVAEGTIPKEEEEELIIVLVSIE